MLKMERRRWRTGVQVWGVCLALLALGALNLRAAEELTAEEVKELTSGVLSIHITQHKMDAPFLKRLVKEFLKRLDPQRTFYLQAEAEAKTNLSNDDLAAAGKALKNGDLSFFSGWIAEFKTQNLPRDETFFNGLQEGRAEIEKEFTKEERAKFETWKPDDYPATEELRRERVMAITRSNFQLYKSYLVADDAFKLVLQGLGRQRDEKKKLDPEKDAPAEVMKAFMSALDPHSEYMDAEDMEEFNSSMARSFAGIGVQIRASPNGAHIMEVIKGGPASKNGKMGPGDQIIAVDETSVLGFTLPQIVKRIKGEKGTGVKISLLKAAAAGEERRTETVELVRDTIELSELRVTRKKETTAAGAVGEIAVENFYRGVAGDVAERIKELSAERPLAGLVLDLRGNSGGLLEEAVRLSGLFISEGPVVAERGKENHSEWREDPDKNTVYDGPLVVLVNQFSASASEIVAGCLKDYGRAVVVGPSPTHGKGTVQSIVDLQRLPNPLPGEIRITVRQYFLPGGDSVQLVGVEPDIRIPGEKVIEELLERKQEGALPAAKIKGRIANLPDYLHHSAWKNEHLAALLETSRRRVALNKDFDAYRKAEKGIKEEPDEKVEKKEEPAEPKAPASGDPAPAGTPEVKHDGTKEGRAAKKLKDPQMDEAVGIVADMIGLWPKASDVAKTPNLEPVPEQVK